MLASQQFCVKWNSYSSNLQNVFPRLLTSEHFVDITLACEGQMIKCHKVVLSACSTYFEKLLIQNPCQHPIIFMKDMKHWEVQALVDFMYKGEVNVSQDELNSLLVAAEALQIRGLCGSDSTNRNPQDPPKINSPTVSPPKVPPVSLPHDTVLSGSSSFGRESPPAIKRKRSNDEKDVIPKITNAMPTTQGRSPSVPNNSEGNSLLAQSSGDVDRNSKIEGQAEEGSEEEKKVIKQEIDMDDTFGDGEVDGDAADEDYANQGQQDDSDSTLREDGLGPSLLDQPGPSGMIPAGDKTATGLIQEICLPLAGGVKYSNETLRCFKSEISLCICPDSLPEAETVNDIVSPNYVTFPRRGRRLKPVGRDELLPKAAEYVLSGQTLRGAERVFNIPRTTLRRYMISNGLLAHQ